MARIHTPADFILRPLEKAGMNRSCKAVRGDISGDSLLGCGEYLKNPDHDGRNNLDLTAPGAIMRQPMEGFDMEHNGRCV